MSSKLKQIIQLEGVDAVGKSIVSKTLKERYEEKGLRVFVLHFPFYDSPTGKIVKDFLMGDLIGDPTKADPIISSIYYTADRLTFFKNNPQIFTDYDILICDRSYMSNFFFQTVKYGGCDNYFDNVIEYIKTFCNLEVINTPLKNFITSINTIVLRHPDVSINFDLMANRSGVADMHESNKEYLKSVDDNISRILVMQNTLRFKESLTTDERMSYSSTVIFCSEMVSSKKKTYSLKNVLEICNEIMSRINI
jgi:dTMP kinase